MLNIIKRVLIAYKVCRKYKVKFHPYQKNSSEGSFIIYCDGECHIWCNLFCIYFYETLFHELGHVIDCRKTEGYQSGRYRRYKGASLSHGSINYEIESCYSELISSKLKENSNLYSKRVTSEIIASRTAVKMLKSCNLLSDTSLLYLGRCFSTYNRMLDKRYIADIQSKAERYIKGEVNIKF